MLAALLIVFREVLEAGLIVGIVLAATRGLAGRATWISGGIACGVAGAGVVAVFASAISDALSGMGQEVFNAAVLSIAAVMLGWHNLWMGRHGRELAQRAGAMGAAVAAGARSLLALAIVVAVAVLREGAEVVLFLYGIAASEPAGWGALLMGGMLGVVAGGVVSWLLYRGLIAIPVSRLFDATGLLIALMAAGMAGQAAVFLVQANLLPPWGEAIWDTSSVLPEPSLVGRALKALVGYSDRPMGIQLAVYTIVLAVLLLGGRLGRGTPVASRPGSAVTSAQS
jgi:high-affinity iron transporter